MTVFMDKFKVGDKVTWRDECHAKITNSQARFGDGPFTVSKVHDLIDERWEGEEQSTWQSVGHTQHLELEGDIGKCLIITEGVQRWSGAFFKVVA